MKISSLTLYPHQEKALFELSTGSILRGEVGSGKSVVALAYFYHKVCGDKLESSTEKQPGLKYPRDLVIITTARKRDMLEWDKECARFGLTINDRTSSLSNILVTVDSWNNIKKYTCEKNKFFMFDEQRVIGSKTWVRAFLLIAKTNDWILLSATPGDRWLDYIPVFVANGFYKNRTEFLRTHAIYNRYSRFPKIDRYVGVERLNELKENVTVVMNYKRSAKRNSVHLAVDYDQVKYRHALRHRWDPYKEEPIKDAAGLCFVLRKIVNSDLSRIKKLQELYEKHDKIILFYNFNYELDLLRASSFAGVTMAEYNGHKHEEIPNTDRWLYLVQYSAGAEGWNCIETNVVVYYSQNYSYRITKQAGGRIDRLNSIFDDLFYYHFFSFSNIDIAIRKALSKKKKFNENSFLA